MARKYYNIFTRTDAASSWAPQFGDFDKEVVQEERKEYRREHKATDIKIVVTAGCSRKAVQAALDALNA